jgi:hypothetical protein
LWLAQNDFAHDSECSADKTIFVLLSCMFCNTRANAQSARLWLAQKSHDFDYARDSACSAGNTNLLLSCMFCNTRANAHNLVSFVASTEIARFDSAHDFWMFCRQTTFLLLKSGKFGPFFP